LIEGSGKKGAEIPADMLSNAEENFKQATLGLYSVFITPYWTQHSNCAGPIEERGLWLSTFLF
jgi:hypothetical protein